jgi:hypothetical protein
MSTNLPPRRTPPPGSQPEDADKEQYSLDEMMKALRDQEREKEERGEVVTRADGTLARKVKRRRRRTKQPDKVTPEKTRKRFMVKLVAGALLVVLLLLVGVFLIVHQNSKSYREGIEKEIADWTGAEVNLSGMKKLPLSCHIDDAQLVWGPEYFVKDLKLRKLSGDVGFASFLGARPGGLLFGAKTGKMTLQTPMGEWQGVSLENEDDFPFAFSQYYCEALEVGFGQRSPLQLKDVSAVLGYEGSEGYQVTLDDGVLRLAGWEDLSISSGLILIRDGMVDVRKLSLEYGNTDRLSLGADLVVTGEVPLKPGSQAKLSVETEVFPLEGLVGRKLSQIIEGSLMGSKGEVSFTLGLDQLDEVKVDFTGRSARLKNLPFLSNLDQLFPEGDFDLLDFDAGITKTPLTGTLRVRPGGMALENLELKKQGKISLQGGLIVGADDRIRGTFDMTLNRVFLTENPKLKNSPLLAGTLQSGYVKLRFKVGGTLTNPTDNFLEMIGATGFVAPETPGKEDLWDDFLNPRKPQGSQPVPPKIDLLEDSPEQPDGGC